MTARDQHPLGLVYDLPNEAYHAGPGVSNSMLAEMARSPAHCWANCLDPNRPARDAKAGQLEGTLAHCATLEPAEFPRRYVAAPEDAPRRPTDAQWAAKKPSPESVAAMDWWREFTERVGSAEIVPADKIKVAHAQAASVRRLPQVAELLSRGAPEVSAYWIDDATGLLCRCRPDWVHPVNDNSVILLDLKTYSDASPGEFSRQVARKGYHRQAAWYSDGFERASGKQVLGFVFVAVETEPPFAACPHMLDDPGIDKGRELNRALLDRYAECVRSGAWPAYGDEIKLITLPAWAIKEAA